MGKDQPQRAERTRSRARYWVVRGGKLYARLQYRLESGEYKTKYRAITDKRVAHSVVEEMRRELDLRGNEGFDAGKMTFNELADKYEKIELVEAVYRDGIKVRGKRSLSSPRYMIRMLREHFGHQQISKIKVSDLKAFKNQRIMTPVEKQINVRHEVKTPGRKKWTIVKETRSTPRKMATVHRELALLRAILNFAFANDWILVNPFQRARGIISAAAEVERDRVLSFEEEDRLLSACVDERAHIRPILICALDTAMRLAEILKTKWADVSLATGEITIPITNTKTERARTVSMTDRLRRELLRLWDISPKDPSVRVFGITDNIRRAFTTACHNANISDFRFHDCRHTATTRMIASGSPHAEVMKITGHSQMKTFLRYLTITQTTANRVASKLDDYLSQSRPPHEISEYLQ